MTGKHDDHSIYTDSDEFSALPIGRIQYSGELDEFVIIGHTKYYRWQLMKAFGGTLNPGLAPFPNKEYANPAPMGLAAFSMTTFVLSMCNAKAMGIEVPAIVVGLACFYGGAAQFLAGMWEFVVGNDWGGCALVSYGSFWLSYAAITIEAFGIASAYEDPKMLDNAIGFYLVGWALFTLMLVFTTVKSTVAFFSLFFSLFVTFVLLAAGKFSGIEGVGRAGGVVGVVCSILGWYNAFAGAANRQNSYITANPIPLPGNK